MRSLRIALCLIVCICLAVGSVTFAGPASRGGSDGRIALDARGGVDARALQRTELRLGFEFARMLGLLPQLIIPADLVVRDDTIRSGAGLADDGDPIGSRDDEEEGGGDPPGPDEEMPNDDDDGVISIGRRN